MTPPSLGLVVPMFDEEERIGEYGEELADFVAAQPPGSELLLVDDGSSDATAALADALAARRPEARIDVVRRPHLGKGATVAAGIAASTADVVAFCDLDLSTPLGELRRVVDAAATAPILAIGSRDVTGSTLVRRESRLREALGRTYNRLLQATVTPGVVDTQCGAKAARRAIWDEVLPYCRQQGFAWDAEVVAVAAARGIGVLEVPIAWRHDDRSKVRVGRDGLAMVLETGRIWHSARRARQDRQAERATAPPAGTSFEDGRGRDLLAADVHHWWFRSKSAFVATALARIGAPRGGDGHAGTGLLVDVGAGAGGVTAALGWDPSRIVAVEPAPTLAAVARHHRGLPTVVAGTAPLPLRDGVAAVVCLLDVLEHLHDPDVALAEALRVLRPDGRLVVTVPGHRWLLSATDAHLGHHRRYDRRALAAALRVAGFEPLAVTHVFSWLAPPVWFERLVRHRGAPALGLDRTSISVDRAALVLTAVERSLVGRLAVPLGTTVLAVATPRPSPRGTPLRR